MTTYDNVIAVGAWSPEDLAQEINGRTILDGPFTRQLSQTAGGKWGDVTQHYAYIDPRYPGGAPGPMPVRASPMVGELGRKRG